MAQKARRKVEEKAREEAERQSIAEKKKKKKRTVEYLQQLQDEVLKEEAAFLEGLRNLRSQDLSIRKLLLEIRRGNGPLRRLEGSNQRSTAEVPQ